MVAIAASAKPNIMTAHRYYTEEEVALLRARYADTPTEQLARQLGRKIGSVHQKAIKLGLHKSRDLVVTMAREAMADPRHGGRASQFKPGIVPANKGLRRPGWAPGRMAESQFRKGHKPYTWVPVGSFRVTQDGMLEQKYSDDPGPPGARWRSFARLVWEAANGPAPDGFTVVFRVGRKTVDPNLVTLDALELISRAELMRRNSIHQMPPELADVSRLRGRLTRAINDKAKEAEHHD